MNWSFTNLLVASALPSGHEASCCELGNAGAVGATAGRPLDGAWWPMDTTGFPRRWNCGEWSADLGWLHILSDAGIWGAYMAIPFVLGFFIFKRRTPLPLVSWLFVAFIACCGLGHLLEALIFWYPMYRLAGVWKMVTALVSWATVFALVPVVPKVLRWPTLGEVNTRLREEVHRREVAERELMAANAQMGALNRELELRDHALNEHSIVVSTDSRGTITYVNDKFCEISGYGREELIGQNHRIINSGLHSKAFFRDLYATIGRGRVWRGQIRNQKKSGEHYWVDTTIVPFFGCEGTIERYVAIRTDITERMRAEEALRVSEERLTLAVEGSQDGVWDWNLARDVVYYAPKWCELVGADPETIGSGPEAWYSRVSVSVLPRFRALIEEVRSGRRSTLDTKLEMTRSDGATRVMLCRAAVRFDDTGRATRMCGSISDITELHEAQEQLVRMARHDPLTGLANREVLSERLEQEIRRARRDSHRFALLFFDFDRFKVINDSLGHGVGDALLISIGERLREQTRDTDTVARFGGDEFVVLLTDIESDEGALATCDRLLAELSRPHLIDGNEVVSTASIGVVCSDPSYRAASEIIRDADAAMYAAKLNGKAQYRMFDAQLHSDAVERLQMEQEMRRADPEHEFRILYQPIVSLNTGVIEGFEALLRWEHPKLGVISPDKFIGIAEETGQIVPIGRWVMMTSCRQLREWQDRLGPGRRLKMNVNLSRRQLIDADLIDVIGEVLEETGIDPSSLRLEITETAVMSDMSRVIPVMDRIRGLGVKLAIDDFGTGHSSLSCLHQFPINVLKIDRSFIWNIEERWDFTAVMHAIVTLAHHLRLEVVAEGVETEGQVAQLQGMECTLGQGYLFSRPVDAREAWRLLGESGLSRSAA
ncbi:MAG: EAL domain-containing protein [Phycisphaerales bacterium]